MTDVDTGRRSFIELGATIAAGALAFPDVIREQNMSREHAPLGVALVGLGSLSTNQIAPALQKTTHCRLAGIVTGTPAKAAQWQAKYGLPSRSVYDYASMDRMADNPAIDIVYVVTPNAMHGEHAIKAARAGKHVFCEKPMEVTTARCEEMIAACKKAGRQLGIAYRCQFEPNHLECIRLAREGVFGRTLMIEAGFGFPIGDPAQWRLNKSLSGGGPVMDVGIYCLQTARMITGEEPTHVTALATKTDPVKFKSVEETVTFQLTFPGGVIADCRTTFKMPGVNRLSVYAERGSFGLEPAYNYTGNRGWRSDRQPFQFDPVDSFAAELDAFAQTIIAGTPNKVPGEEGLRDVRVLLAIYESIETGRTIRL